MNKKSDSDVIEVGMDEYSLDPTHSIENDFNVVLAGAGRKCDAERMYECMSDDLNKKCKWWWQ